MFHRAEKKVKAVHTKPLEELVEIVTPLRLLECPKRQDLLQKLNTSSLLEPARYNSLCVKLIHILINYCQRLPETANSYYSAPAGFLDHALNRTEAAMSLFRQYMVLPEKGNLVEDQALWSYALFSASLLKDIGKLYVDFSVDLYDTNGQFLTHWNPLLDSMISVGHYYHYQFQGSNDLAFKYALNTLFAKLLMPNSGFKWIASNEKVLKVWLGLLDDDESGSGTLKAILSRADDIAIQRELHALLLKSPPGGGGRGNRIGTFVDVPTDSEDIKRAVGIKFIRWVQQELSIGRLIINKGPLRIVSGGMVMSEVMYQLFVKAHPEYKKWQIVQNGFISLGAHKISRDGAVVLRNDLDDKADMKNGILLKRSTVLLPDEIQMADLTSGNVRTVSAIEVAHAMYEDSSSPDANLAVFVTPNESSQNKHGVTRGG